MNSSDVNGLSPSNTDTESQDFERVLEMKKKYYEEKLAYLNVNYLY